MHYVSFDQWIVEAFTMSAWFKCSQLLGQISTCPECLSAAYVEAVIRYLCPSLGPEVGACLCQGRFLIEIDFVSSEGSCCNR